MTYPSLRGRSIIVTGAGRGFGRLMAEALCAAGANVLGTAGRNRDELDDVARGMAAKGQGRFEGLVADVSSDADCQRTFRTALERFGRVDVLVNNAARGPLEADADYFNAKPKFWEAPADAWRRMIETNLVGAFLMARAVTPHMVANGFGRIVNISTSYPTMVFPGLAAYGASKAGLETATVMWARDLQGTGVTANVLLPGGPADTALIPGGVIGTRAKSDFRPGKGPRGDEGRVGGILPPEIMVPPTLWLCADESGGVTGRRLVAKDWDPDLPPDQAARGCMTEQRAAPHIM